ncbi:MAG: hypothetical protein GX282_01840 [Campylobacteraceae bacterium]|nr:hypothetical protein [Campylobacteraceae bacterium]
MFDDIKFKKLMKSHAKECLEFILGENYEFGVVANLSKVKFDPVLPKEINDSFKLPVIFFELAGYTLQSAEIVGETLKFEAGFGEENFASTLTIPFEAIVQIIYKKVPIFINTSTQDESEDEKREKSKKIFSLDD